MTEHTEITRRAKTVDPQPMASLVGPARISNRFAVLLLEDEPLISMDIEMTLGGSDFDVFNVMSCQEALAWLDLRQPDAAIVDVDLRDGRCTDVVSRLARANIPFIVHSGQQEHRFADTPFAGGSWVGKPSAPDELLGAVKAAVSGLSKIPTPLMTG